MQTVRIGMVWCSFPVASPRKAATPPFQAPLSPSLLYVTTGRQQERSQSMSAFVDPISNGEVTPVLIGTIIRKS